MSENVSARPPTGDQWQALVQVVLHLARLNQGTMTVAQKAKCKALLERAGVVPPRLDLDTLDTNWF